MSIAPRANACATPLLVRLDVARLNGLADRAAATSLTLSEVVRASVSSLPSDTPLRASRGDEKVAVINVRFSVTDMARLTALSDAHGVKKSVVVRAAIDRALAATSPST